MAIRQFKLDDGQGGWFRESRPHHDAALKGRQDARRHIPANDKFQPEAPSLQVKAKGQRLWKIKEELDRLYERMTPAMWDAPCPERDHMEELRREWNGLVRDIEKEVGPTHMSTFSVPRKQKADYNAGKR